MLITRIIIHPLEQYKDDCGFKDDRDGSVVKDCIPKTEPILQFFKYKPFSFALCLKLVLDLSNRCSYNKRTKQNQNEYGEGFRCCRSIS